MWLDGSSDAKKKYIGKNSIPLDAYDEVILQLSKCYWTLQNFPRKNVCTTKRMFAWGKNSLWRLLYYFQPTLLWTIDFAQSNTCPALSAIIMIRDHQRLLHKRPLLPRVNRIWFRLIAVGNCCVWPELKKILRCLIIIIQMSI